MIVVGIDSAATSGIAAIASDEGGRRVVRHGTVPAHSGEDVERAVAELAAIGPDLVVLEAPYVRFTPGRGGNAQTGLSLAVLLGRWLQSWERRGVETRTVLASVWQQQLLGVSRWADRYARKAAAQRWALAELGLDLTEDVADAVCIAAHALRPLPAPAAAKRPRGANLTLPCVSTTAPAAPDARSGRRERPEGT